MHLLHLQCHIGLDTLCLARRGAIVTGLDFSGVAIAAARDIAERDLATASKPTLSGDNSSGL